MCGIFAVIKDRSQPSSRSLLAVSKKLGRLSERRGNDASGLAFAVPMYLQIIKKNASISSLFSGFTQSEKCDLEKSDLVVGHARLETNGTSESFENNHPILTNDLALFHNGIITNHFQISKTFFPSSVVSSSDTKTLVNLIEKFKTDSGTAKEAIKKALELAEGSYSIILFDRKEKKLFFVSNTGNLYRTKLEDGLSILASEEQTIKSFVSRRELASCKIEQIEKNCVQEIDLTLVWENAIEFKCSDVSIKKVKNSAVSSTEANFSTILKMKSDLSETKDWVATLRRCKHCILPESIPGIFFDSNGICNQCNSFQTHSVKSIDRLLLQTKKNKTSRYDCLVAFSGGRDSSYVLHYLVKVLGLKVATFSYDWGVLSDIGRRNQARMTGCLGVENVLISADINEKRTNILKNILAWTRRPDLGMIPLLMAGDKQYYWWANRIQKELGDPLLVMGENRFEKTMFKLSLAGISQTNKQFMAYDVSFAQTLKLLGFYTKQMALNPKYLNSSLLDSASAFFSYFGNSRNYSNLFDFVKWDETTIDQTLSQYGWERSIESESTWRIGDGTPPLYNFIYFRSKGFTEFDTLYSNMIRDGQMSREQALKKSKLESEIKQDSLLWYANTIGIDLNIVRNAVQKIAHDFK